MVSQSPPNHYIRKSPTKEEREAIHALSKVMEADESDVVRAIAQSIGDKLLDGFKNKYGVDKPTTGATCLDRLKGNRCGRGYHGKTDHPHSIPHADHRSLWLRDGEPALVVNHLYDLPWSYVVDIVEYCEEHGFEATFDAYSWYFPGQTIMIVIKSSGED